MGRVQLDHVEPRTIRHLSCVHELIAHLVHLCAGDFARGGVLVGPWDRRCADDIPVALWQRRIHLVPAKLSGAFAPRMTDLAADLGIRLHVYEIGNAGPCGLMFWRI